MVSHPDDGFRSSKVRIALSVSKEAERKIENIARFTSAKSKSNVLVAALEAFDVIVEEVSGGGDILVQNDDKIAKIDLIDGELVKSKDIIYTISKNKKELIHYSNILERSIQDYRSNIFWLGHNNPPSDLNREDLIAQLDLMEKEISELKKNLENLNIEGASKQIYSVQKNVNVFMDNFTPIVGKGAALLLVTVAAAMLGKAGLDTGIIASLVDKITK
ncbi:MAG: hypothetical protein AAFQ10_03640 [Pseudomonadota bacterium]